MLWSKEWMKLAKARKVTPEHLMDIYVASEMHVERVKQLFAVAKEFMTKLGATLPNDAAVEAAFGDFADELNQACDWENIWASDGLCLDREWADILGWAEEGGFEIESPFEVHPDWQTRVASEFEREALAKNRDPHDLADELAGRKRL